MSTDFSQGKVWRNIVAQAIPLIMAQMVQNSKKQLRFSGVRHFLEEFNG